MRTEEHFEAGRVLVLKNKAHPQGTQVVDARNDRVVGLRIILDHFETRLCGKRRVYLRGVSELRCNHDSPSGILVVFLH